MTAPASVPPTAPLPVYLDTSDLRACSDDPRKASIVQRWMDSRGACLALSPVHISEWAWGGGGGMGRAANDLRWHVDRWSEVVLLPSPASMAESWFQAARYSRITCVVSARRIATTEDMTELVRDALAGLHPWHQAGPLVPLFWSAFPDLNLRPFDGLDRIVDALNAGTLRVPSATLRYSEAEMTARLGERLRGRRKSHPAISRAVREALAFQARNGERGWLRRSASHWKTLLGVTAFLRLVGPHLGPLLTYDLVLLALRFFAAHFRRTGETPRRFFETAPVWHVLPIGLMTEARGLRFARGSVRPSVGDWYDDMHLLYAQPQGRLTVDARTLEFVRQTARRVPNAFGWSERSIVQSGIREADWES